MALEFLSEHPFDMKQLERWPNNWGLVNRAAVGVEKEEQVSGAWRAVD